MLAVDVTSSFKYNKVADDQSRPGWSLTRSQLVSRASEHQGTTELAKRLTGTVLTNFIRPLFNSSLS